MFLHLGRFTKQVKEAYKNYHLDIGNINDGLLISSGHWMVWVKNQHVSNEIKAVVMLLAGTLPKPGEMFTVEKEKADPQYKIVDEYFYRYISPDLHFKLVVTPIVLAENYDIRMIQGPDRQVYGIRQEFLDMIDNEVIDFDAGEGTPTGPCFSGDIRHGVYWYNDFGVVMICPMMTKRIEIPAVLSLLEFKEDGNIGKRYLGNAVTEAFYDDDETTLDDDGSGESGDIKNSEPDYTTETTDTEGAE